MSRYHAKVYWSFGQFMIQSVKAYADSDRVNEWEKDGPDYLLNPYEADIGIEGSDDFYVDVIVFVDEPAGLSNSAPLFVHVLKVPNGVVEFHAPDSAEDLLIKHLSQNVEVTAFRLEAQKYVFEFKNL